MKRRSAIYVGAIRHRRHAPRRHHFRVPGFMMLIDLDEAPRLFDGRWLWSHEKTNVATFRRSDYHGDPGRPLDECVRDLVEERTGRRPVGPISLLTNLRYWNYCFNPLSLYFCYDADGEKVEVTLAEVTNTPWGERIQYVLPATESRGGEAWQRFQFQKGMHVSPFMDMDLVYDWRMIEPAERFALRIDLLQAGRPIFDAALSLRRREITGWNLARTLALHPWMTGKVVAMIHWHALRLWLKGVGFRPHPSKQTAGES